MPRYHFNVYDGIIIPDEFGVELPDITYARREAIRYAASLLEDGGTRDNLGQEWHMEVVDADGVVLFRLDFFVKDSPAVESMTKPKLGSSDQGSSA